MVRAAGEKFSGFFWAILYIFSQLGGKYAYFYQLGEKYAFPPFPPFFHPLFNQFFFPNMLFGHKQKIYTPVIEDGPLYGPLV